MSEAISLISITVFMLLVKLIGGNKGILCKSETDLCNF